MSLSKFKLQSSSTPGFCVLCAQVFFPWKPRHRVRGGRCSTQRLHLDTADTLESTLAALDAASNICTVFKLLNKMLKYVRNQAPYCSGTSFPISKTERIILFSRGHYKEKYINNFAELRSHTNTNQETCDSICARAVLPTGEEKVLLVLLIMQLRAACKSPITGQ